MVASNGKFENIKDFDISKLVEFLITSRKCDVAIRTSKDIIIAWNTTCYWYCSVGSEKPIHTYEDLCFYVKLKESFKLPNIWHVLVTKENQEVLSKWRFEGHPNELSIDYIVGMTKDWRYNWKYNKKYVKSHNPSYNKENFGEEITFEQFKKYVLKSTVEENLPQTQTNNNGNSKQKLENGNTSIILRRIDSTISRGDKIRETSVRSTKSKITIGSYNCNY